MTPEETRAALERFYDAFARRDGETMAAMYAADASFEDPVFRLSGADIGKMWIALARRAKDFSVAYTVAQAGTDRGVVEWTARYLFSGRNRVENVVLTDVEFRGGLIVRQVDQFDFDRWAAQALGLPGKLLSRFDWFRRKVRAKAAAGVGVPPKV